MTATKPEFNIYDDREYFYLYKIQIRYLGDKNKMYTELLYSVNIACFYSNGVAGDKLHIKTSVLY